MAAPARTGARSQTFLAVVAKCWARPGLLLVELGWRWLCGSFLLLLFGLAAFRIADATRPAIESTGLFNATLESTIADPSRISVAMASSIAILRPWLQHELLGLAPLALFAWVAAFALGRTILLRRWDAGLPRRPWLLAVCEAARLLVLGAVSAVWYWALGWAARFALGPAQEVPGTGAQADPNLVLYCALVIVITVGLFTVWSLTSWALVAAPLVALLERASFGEGLARSLRRRRERGALVEVNLSMAVIKIALIVLATVLSATPLPFEAIMQGWPLTAWWVFVTLLYLAASDFFKMARLFAFLEQLRQA